MASNGRGSLRPHHGSKTPPFVLIGLLVVIVILGFNYWNASSKSSLLSKEILLLNEQMRSVSLKQSSVDKRNEELVAQVVERERENTLCKTTIADKDGLAAQLTTSIKQLESQKNEEANTCRSNLDQERLNHEASAARLQKQHDNQLADTRREVEDEAHNNCVKDMRAKKKEILQIIAEKYGKPGILHLQQAGIDVSVIDINSIPELPSSPTVIQSLQYALAAGRPDLQDMHAPVAGDSQPAVQQQPHLEGNSLNPPNQLPNAGLTFGNRGDTIQGQLTETGDALQRQQYPVAGNSQAVADSQGQLKPVDANLQGQSNPNFDDFQGQISPTSSNSQVQFNPPGSNSQGQFNPPGSNVQGQFNPPGSSNSQGQFNPAGSNMPGNLNPVGYEAQGRFNPAVGDATQVPGDKGQGQIAGLPAGETGQGSNAGDSFQVQPPQMAGQQGMSSQGQHEQEANQLNENKFDGGKLEGNEDQHLAAAAGIVEANEHMIPAGNVEISDKDEEDDEYVEEANPVNIAQDTVRDGFNENWEQGGSQEQPYLLRESSGQQWIDNQMDAEDHDGQMGSQPLPGQMEPLPGQMEQHPLPGQMQPLPGQMEPLPGQMEQHPLPGQMQPLPGQVEPQPLSGQMQPLPGQIEPQPLPGQVEPQPLPGQMQPLPGQMEPLPGQMEPLPGQLEQHQLPGQMQPLPGQVEPQPLPDQMQPLPGQMQPLPGQMQPLPGQMQPLPGQMEPLPGQMQPRPLPGQMEPLPGQMEPLSGQMEPKPLQGLEQGYIDPSHIGDATLPPQREFVSYGSVILPRDKFITGDNSKVSNPTPFPGDDGTIQTESEANLGLLDAFRKKVFDSEKPAESVTLGPASDLNHPVHGAFLEVEPNLASVLGGGVKKEVVEEKAEDVANEMDEDLAEAGDTEAGDTEAENQDAPLTAGVQQAAQMAEGIGANEAQQNYNIAPPASDAQWVAAEGPLANLQHVDMALPTESPQAAANFQTGFAHESNLLDVHSAQPQSLQNMQSVQPLQPVQSLQPQFESAPQLNKELLDVVQSNENLNPGVSPLPDSPNAGMLEYASNEAPQPYNAGGQEERPVQPEFNQLGGDPASVPFAVREPPAGKDTYGLYDAGFDTGRKLLQYREDEYVEDDTDYDRPGLNIRDGMEDDNQAYVEVRPMVQGYVPVEPVVEMVAVDDRYVGDDDEYHGVDEEIKKLEMLYKQPNMAGVEVELLHYELSPDHPKYVGDQEELSDVSDAEEAVALEDENATSEFEEDLVDIIDESADISPVYSESSKQQDIRPTLPAGYLMNEQVDAFHTQEPSLVATNLRFQSSNLQNPQIVEQHYPSISDAEPQVAGRIEPNLQGLIQGVLQPHGEHIPGVARVINDISQSTTGQYDTAERGQYTAAAPQMDMENGMHAAAAPQINAERGQNTITASQMIPESGQYAAASPQTNAESGQYVAAAPQMNAESGQYVAAAPQMNAESGQYDAAAPQMNAESGHYDAAAPQMNAESVQYVAAAPQMNAESGQYVAAAPQLNAESRQYVAVAPQMNAESRQYVAVAPQMNAESRQYVAAAPQLNAESRQYVVAAPQMNAESGQYVAAAPQMNAESGQYAAAAPQTNAESGQYVAAAPQMNAESGQYVAAAPQLNGEMGTYFDKQNSPNPSQQKQDFVANESEDYRGDPSEDRVESATTVTALNEDKVQAPDDGLLLGGKATGHPAVFEIVDEVQQDIIDSQTNTRVGAPRQVMSRLDRVDNQLENEVRQDGILVNQAVDQSRGPLVSVPEYRPSPRLLNPMVQRKDEALRFEQHKDTMEQVLDEQDGIDRMNQGMVNADRHLNKGVQSDMH